MGACTPLNIYYKKTSHQLNLQIPHSIDNINIKNSKINNM